MPSRSELPGEIKGRKFEKALERVGFAISKKGGKGGHYKAVFQNEKMIIIPSETLRRDQLYYLLKEIEKISGITWDDIKKKL